MREVCETIRSIAFWLIILAGVGGLVYGMGTVIKESNKREHEYRMNLINKGFYEISVREGTELLVPIETFNNMNKEETPDTKGKY